MKEFDAIVFDLDDTLFDLAAAKARAHLLLPGLGIEISEFKLIEQRWWDRFGEGECSYAELRRGRWVEAGLPEASIEEIDASYVSLSDRVFLKTGAKRLLTSLRSEGFKLAVLTNAPGPTQRAKMLQCGILHEFDAIGICDELGFGKPAIQSYRAVCSAMFIDIERAIMVGDDLEKDVYGPLRAGMRGAVWLPKKEADISHVTDMRVRIAHNLAQVRPSLGLCDALEKISA